jgi:predicted nucleotidyltransferase
VERPFRRSAGMNLSHIRSVTPYPDVNAVLYALTDGCLHLFLDNLVGVYLFGSLSYGDFNPDSSDIDLFVVLKQPVSKDELTRIEHLHWLVAMEHPKWADRVECSYTPLDMLNNILPPEQPRPYYGESHLYEEAQYGNEWIINLYLLYRHGITLYGPDFKQLVAPVNIEDVRQACACDLYREWEPKLRDPDWLKNSHYQSYIILNLCRILYTVLRGETGSKKVSAAWVKGEFPQWRDLIEAAERWRYGTDMRRQDETLAFIRFVVNLIPDNRQI